MYGALRGAFFESYTICPLRSYCQYPPLYIWVSRGPETCVAEPALLGHPVKSGEGCYCSVTKSCPTLHDPMDCSTPGFPVPHHLPEFVQVHAHWVSDAIPPSHPLSSPSHSAFNISQHQGLFQWVSSSWSFSFSISPSIKHSRLISFRMDWLDLLAVQETLKSLLQHHSSKASIIQHSAFFIVQISHPYMTTGKTTVWLDGPLPAE